MRISALLLGFILLWRPGAAQSYFPPNIPGAWDTLSPSSLGWCPDKIDSLYAFLDASNTRAFILLKEGRIVLEHYSGGQTAEAYWYWASAGKTLTAVLTGIAQQEGYLEITDTTSAWLGEGWTGCNAQQERGITLRNQLTMTAGFDDAGPDPYCTLDSCLVCIAAPGARWAYHNAPYTLLDEVIEQATGRTLNQYTAQKVGTPTGMDGFFLRQGYNNVFFSTARSMARFGLLILNCGIWDGSPVLADTAYFHDMVNTSQELNLSYGYLWWLNGKSSFMVPQSQLVFPGSLSPHAPADMIAAMGKNGQFINVVPSQGMVWIRMGDAPDNALVPFLLNDDIWRYISLLPCQPGLPAEAGSPGIRVFPGPAREILFIELSGSGTGPHRYLLLDAAGRVAGEGTFTGDRYGIATAGLACGTYILKIVSGRWERSVVFIRE